MSSLIEGTNRIAPMLVSLYDSQRLYALAEENKPQARRKLTESMTELLDQDFTPRESELIADILISLVRQAEHDLKQALAERLSVLETAPTRLVLALTHEDIDIASPVLQYSSVLQDMDLIYIIKSQGQDYWRAMARRASLSDQVMDALADTGDVPTAIALAENTSITLTTHTANTLGAMACSNDDLASPLVMRSDLPPAVLRQIYRAAGEGIRQYISVYHQNPEDGAVWDDTLDDVISDYLDASDGMYRPGQKLIDHAASLNEAGQLDPERIIDTLKRGHIAAFVACFACYCTLSVDTVMEILQQTNGQGLAVACRAKDISRDDFIQIFLLTRKLADPQGLVDDKDLNKALSYYAHTRKGVARRILKNSHVSGVLPTRH